MSCNITKQLTENKLKHGIVPMRTKIKILQLNRLEANSFFSVKLWTQTKNCKNIFDGPIKIKGTHVLVIDGNGKQMNF